MKTVKLKITAAEHKRRKAEMKDSLPCCGNDDYPYGFRLSLDKDLIKKFPQFEDAEGGATFNFSGKCRVKEISTTQRDGESKNQRVEIQIEEIGFDANEDDLEDAFETED